jgi:hypothetical protein
LADLHLSEFSDNPGTDEKTKQKGGQTGPNRPKGDIAKNVEPRKRRMQRVEKKINHGLLHFPGLNGLLIMGVI